MASTMAVPRPVNVATEPTVDAQFGNRLAHEVEAPFHPIPVNQRRPVAKRPRLALVPNLDRASDAQETAGSLTSRDVDTSLTWSFSQADWEALTRNSYIDVNYDPPLFDSELSGRSTHPVLPVEGSEPGVAAGFLYTNVGGWVTCETPAPQAFWSSIAPILNIDPLQAYGYARRTATQSRDAAAAELVRRLDASRAGYAARDPRVVADYLLEDLGMSQVLVAQAIAVTPTAVRKWRRGEPPSSEHREQLARVAALADTLGDLDVYEPAGWLDIPISTASPLTPLDLFLADRADLVMLFGAKLASPDETLDAFDDGWRATFAVNSDYEVVVLADGSRSAVPRRQA